jgi:Domain of unknown function (DUF4304)
MTNDIRRALEQGLAPALKAHGFAKSGATWRRTGADAFSVVNLQGSQWGASSYVNLGVYFRALGDDRHPAESVCHIRTRLDALVPDPEALAALLDMQREMPAEDRARECAALIVAHGLPWLDAVATVSGARAFCGSPRADSVLVSMAARAFLASA